MFLDIVFLVSGLALILGGANFLTDGASAVARKMKVSDLVIGLTIVAFGTSAPELTISAIAAISGKASLAVGNVVGSNIFNILMILGCTALIMPLSIGKGTLSKEIPLVILASLVLFFCASDMLIDGASTNVISRVEGLVLLAFFLIFMRYTFSIAKSMPEEENESEPAAKPLNTWLAALYILGGLVALIGGGELFVDGASAVARAMGVSDAVIGLTLVAAGTSLPELATSVVAALKRNPGIAIGNVVGSCLFNIFMIIGVSATLRPLPLGSLKSSDLLMMVFAAALLMIFSAFFGERTLKRWEGGVMVAAFIGYTVWLVLGA